MLITLFTDAGFCPQTKVASYAVWAKCDGNCFRKAGILKGSVANAQIAELRAIINGLVCVKTFFAPGPRSKIICQTDCLTAIQAARGTGYMKKKRQREEIKTERDLLQKVTATGIEIEYRHVTGHRGFKDKRSSVNTWCDKECRRFLKAARAGARPKNTSQQQPVETPAAVTEGA